MAVPNNPFTGYNQEQLKKMAVGFGYDQEDMAGFPEFLNKNPDVAQRFLAQQDDDMFGKEAMQKFQTGGIVLPADADRTPVATIAPIPGTFGTPPLPSPTAAAGSTPLIGELTAQRTVSPGLPVGGAFQAVTTPFEAAQNIPITGTQVGTDVTIPTATQATPQQTTLPTAAAAPQITAAAATPDVRTAAAQAAQLQAPTQTIEAAQQAQSNIANIQAAQQAQAVQVQPPVTRTLQAGEVIAAPTGQAQQAAAFIEPVAQAVTAAPTAQATVQGQLVTLLDQFEGGEIPPWARGGVRAAQQVLLQRGLGASSIAGQAIIDAALEQALPIAQADARTVATFEAQNLSNRQQAAMVRAQYRAQFTQQEFDQAFQTRVQNAAQVADIANRNFTSDQQIALENSRLTQTVDLANLNNNQAVTMAQAAALAQLDIANLNNRQQSAVQNAQNFLQIDAANLSNAQQTAVLNSQQQVQALLTDTAAENTARQINARSQQQTDQFYDNLIASIGQANSAQANAINQFNAGQINAVQRFNSEIVNQREQFNARNQLAIGQSNATWRRAIATADTAALNFQNQLNAQNLLKISETAYDNLWQEYRDVLEFAFTAGESELDRINTLQIAQLNANSQASIQQTKLDNDNIRSIGSFAADFFAPTTQSLGSSVNSFLGSLFGTEALTGKGAPTGQDAIADRLLGL